MVSQDKYRPVEYKVNINITGCPNSCSPYRIVDIGFRGLRIREADLGSVEGYEMLIGGDQKSFGLKLGSSRRPTAPKSSRPSSTPSSSSDRTTRP